MILVDTSVWIDFFLGTHNQKSMELTRLLEEAAAPLAIADLALLELLRGFPNERDFQAARRVLSVLNVVEVGGEDNALRATDHYRFLRTIGFTMNGVTDLLQATYCIEHNNALLFSDHDFDAMVSYRGLRTWEYHGGLH